MKKKLDEGKAKGSELPILPRVLLEWWRDGDEEEPVDGGMIVGFLLVHKLPSHETMRHELRVEIPRGWKPENRRTNWYGPRQITPIGDGVRLVPSGGIAVEIAGPLPPVILLPTPHPSGVGFLSMPPGN